MVSGVHPIALAVHLVQRAVLELAGEGRTLRRVWMDRQTYAALVAGVGPNQVAYWCPSAPGKDDEAISDGTMLPGLPPAGEPTLAMGITLPQDERERPRIAGIPVHLSERPLFDGGDASSDVMLRLSGTMLTVSELARDASPTAEPGSDEHAMLSNRVCPFCLGQLVAHERGAGALPDLECAPCQRLFVSRPRPVVTDA